MNAFVRHFKIRVRRYEIGVVVTSPPTVCYSARRNRHFGFGVAFLVFGWLGLRVAWH